MYVMNGILEFAMVIAGLALASFILAWVFVFPVIGFLWTIGWLA